MATLIEDNARVLFQGDSITDCSRNREDPSDLGKGYAMLASSWYSAKHPEKRVEFFNRGIGGDRTSDLVRRWEEDCLALKPDLVSILIGINNTWRRYDKNDPTSVDRFEEEYRAILDSTTKALKTKLILCEPFLLPVTVDQKKWREDLDPKIEVVHELAREYDAILVPLDRLLQEACTKREAAYWAADGVHPSLPGHALIAQAWLKHVGA
ncbi:MAG: SGNH/GDSL hydrolase family protein [Bacteroidota bacterium]